jgi:hypothetical protein
MERRKLLHERAGEVIENLFSERLDDHMNELARHYSRSLITAKAVKYLHLAGQQAARRSAYTEAFGTSPKAWSYSGVFRMIPSARDASWICSSRSQNRFDGPRVLGPRRPGAV